MVSGVKALHELDSAIAKARGMVSNIGTISANAVHEVSTLQQQQVKALQDISNVRLELLEADRAAYVAALKRADQEAEQLLQQHQEDVAHAAANVASHTNTVEQLEAERRQQEDAVAKAVEASTAAAEACLADLQQQPDYAAKQHALAEAEATLVRAEQKLDIAKQDVQVKGKPYLADPLFSYLHRRRYLTPHYKANPLVRFLDGWVARTCNYQPAALNFKRLTDIPTVIEQHVAQLSETLAAVEDAVESMEQTALKNAGAAKLQEAARAQQQYLAGIDTRLATAETAAQEARQGQALLANGQGDAYGKAVTILSAALEKLSLQDLQQLAAQTTSLADDEAVQRLFSLRQQMKQHRRQQQQAEALSTQYRGTLAELEDVRRRFKHHRYDAPSSDISSSMLGALIGQVLGGMLSGDNLWGHIKKAQRTLARYDWDDFELDDLFDMDDWGDSDHKYRPKKHKNRRKRQPWGSSWGSSRSSRSRRRSGGLGGFGGGGFRTGGGFSGGGFKTGGGF